MVLPSYKYDSLQSTDSVRVLVLQPAGTFTAVLECSIIQYSRMDSLSSLDSSTHYDAVSYTWGQPDCTCHIVCDNGSTRLMITQSVDTMLRYLRDSLGPRYLWIDAICLNQSDEAEKAAQIPSMGAIYEQAKTVHIWLGPNEGEGKQIFAFIRALGTVSEDDPQLLETVRTLATKVLGHAPHLMLDRFWELPWFSRLWIIQEAALAHHALVHYGDDEIFWSLLTHGMKKMKLAAKAGFDTSNASLVTLNSLSNVTVGTRSILQLVWDFHGSQCSDPRDRLAALHGLRDKKASGDKILHYESPWTDIFTDHARAFICAGRGLEVLVHALVFGPLSKRDKLLPSWVPDWSQPKKQSHYLPEQMPIKNESASNSLQVRPSFFQNFTGEGEFILTGVREGTLRAIASQGHDWRQTRLAFFNFWLALKKDATWSQVSHDIQSHLSHSRSSQTSNTVRVARAGPLVGKLYSPGLRCLRQLMRDVASLQDFYAGGVQLSDVQVVLESAMEEMEKNSSDENLPVSASEENLFRQLHVFMSRHSLFATDTGFAGFIPLELHPPANFEVLSLGYIQTRYGYGNRIRTVVVITDYEPTSTAGPGQMRRGRGRLLGACFGVPTFWRVDKRLEGKENRSEAQPNESVVIF